MTEILHGVKIESRYSHANEVGEMRNFVSELERIQSSRFVVRVFYDSKASCCSFQLSQDINEIQEHRILSAAKKHISQFEWNGIIDHGEPLGMTIGKASALTTTNDKFQTSSLQAIELFKNVAKLPLQSLLNGEVFSIEEESQASSPTAQVLDMSASSDLVVRYQTTSAVFLAASRLLYSNETDCQQYPLSLTLRNSVNGLYDITELNKLQRAVSILESGVPVVVPRYLCFARIFPKENPTTLYDLLAVETIPLIKHIFSSFDLNLPNLRRQMESENKNEIIFDANLKSLAGIRSSGSNTFLFIGKKYLDIYGLPYLYKRA